MKTILGISVILAVALPAFAQEQREWTSAAGTTVKAKLVRFTQFDVEIENEQGKRLIIARKKFSSEDQGYLKGFAGLKSNGPSRYAPVVRVAASVRGFGGATKKALITLNNASDQELEILICWSWLSSPVNERIELKQNKNLRFFSTERMDTTIQSLETLNIECTPIVPSVDPGAARFEDGFIVQVYYEGDLIANYATKGSQKLLASDPELISRIGNGEVRSREAAKTGLGGSTLGGATLK